MAEPTRFRAYAALLHSRIAAQTAYRLSFSIAVATQVLLVVVEFAEVYVVFHQVELLGGFDFREVTLMYGISAMAFGLADLAVGHVDSLPRYVRTGQLDAFLLRPLSSLGQLVTSDFQLRRLGRVASGLLVLAAALAYADIDWTAGRVLLLVLSPLAGAVIFGAVFVATSTVAFWFVEGAEIANSVTYGGNYLSSFPFTVFGRWLRRLFTFVIPAAFVAYLPTLALVGRPDPLGMPAWATWSSPLVAVLTAAVAGWVWRAGVRHYVGAGS